MICNSTQLCLVKCGYKSLLKKVVVIIQHIYIGINMYQVFTEDLLSLHELFHVYQFVNDVKVQVSYVTVFQVDGVNPDMSIHIAKTHAAPPVVELDSKVAENIRRLVTEDLFHSLYILESLKVVGERVGLYTDVTHYLHS